MSRAKTPPPGILPYIDVVEEALCFGWIDSTLKKLPDGRLAQRLSPRRKNSHWTRLNMDRCMDLEDRGLMTPAGRRAFFRESTYASSATMADSEKSGNHLRIRNLNKYGIQGKRQDILDVIKS